MVTETNIIENYKGDADPTTLIPSTGSSFIDIKELKEVVSLLSQWQYKSALQIINKNIENKNQLVNSLLLKGEIATIHENYEIAIDAYKNILGLEPKNIYALTMVIGHLKIIESDKEEIEAYFKILKTIAPQIAHKLKETLTFIEKSKEEYHYNELSKSLDLICVFGYFLYDDGSMPNELIGRLRKTFELAKKYSQAKILISGGAVQNKYCEAIEMKKKLMEMGLEEERVVALVTAKDTVGNIWEFMEYIQNQSAKNICVVTSMEHLPRAWMSFYIGLKENCVEANLFAASPKGTTHPVVAEKENRLSYQTVLRIAGLFDKESIEKQLQN